MFLLFSVESIHSNDGLSALVDVVAGNKGDVRPAEDLIRNLTLSIGDDTFFKVVLESQITADDRVAEDHGIAGIALNVIDKVVDHHSGRHSIDLVTVGGVLSGFDVDDGLDIAGSLVLRYCLQALRIFP